MPFPKKHGVCANACKHTPVVAATDWHHVKPKSWGGESTAENGRELCDNCHRLTHLILNMAVRLTRFPTRAEAAKALGRQTLPVSWGYPYSLAQLGWDERPEHPTYTLVGNEPGVQ